MTFSKLRVAFNNVYMYATHNIENFEALLRKVIYYGFIQRLENSSNVITESWTICFVDWQSWLSKLYK